MNPVKPIFFISRNKGTWKSLTGLALILILLFGCIEEIDLDGSDQGVGKMVIQGQLLKGFPSKVAVRVSRSSDFKSRGLPPPVSGAVVLVADDSGNELLIPEVEAGLYQVEINDGNDDLPVESGREYMLKVTTGEGGQYVSTMEPLHAVPLADSISIELIEREELDHNDLRQTTPYVQFFIHTPLEVPSNEQKAYLRWDFEAVYQVQEVFVPGPGPGPQNCFVTRSLGLEKVEVFNGNEANSDRLDRYMIVEDLAEARFGLGYLLTVRQQSLSRGAYHYWDQVNETVSLSGGLFEAAPGKIQGNLTNLEDSDEEVFGYFFTSEEQQITRFVRPAEAGNPSSFCDQSQNAGTDVCFDCSLIPFSTKEIPDHWEF